MLTHVPNGNPQQARFSVSKRYWEFVAPIKLRSGGFAAATPGDSALDLLKKCSEAVQQDENTDAYCWTHESRE